MTSELKYSLERGRAAAFLAVTRAHLSEILYDEARPLAFTRTTYLDTGDRAYLRSSRTRHARRIRIRQYAAASGRGAPPRLTGLSFLELKESEQSARRKLRLPIAATAIEEVYRYGLSPQRAASRVDLGPIARIVTHRVLPLMTTWYRRRSYADSSGDIRVTLDTELAFCLPPLPPANDEVARPRVIIGRGPARILEVKAESGDHPAWLALALESLGIPETDLSKYELGMRALDRATVA